LSRPPSKVRLIPSPTSVLISLLLSKTSENDETIWKEEGSLLNFDFAICPPSEDGETIFLERQETFEK